MPTSKTASRASTKARDDILNQLKDDHKRVKKAYRDFQKLDAHENPEACEAIVQQVLQELAVHASVEEELLYPAAREAISEESLIDEAEVEHESLHVLMDQLRGMSPEDEKYVARFTVLCEYLMHHVKEEETEIFPQLERARIDWAQLATEMTERRQELMPEALDDGQGLVAETLEEGEESSDTGQPATGAKGRGQPARRS